jgi:hypothetical protein
MSATFSTVFTSKIDTVETFAGAQAGNPDVSFPGPGVDETITLTSVSTPAITKRAGFKQALTSGAATIDLTALPGITVDETVNGTGLQVQFIKFVNPSTNANKMTIGKGMTSGYQLDGATTWSIVLAPGMSALINTNSASDVIASGKKTIDIAGTGVQPLTVEILMG